MIDDPRFKNRTERERVFLSRYAVDQDIVAATMMAYDMKDRDKARIYGLGILKKEEIAAIVRDHITIKGRELPTQEQLRQFYMDIFHNGASTIREKLQALVAYERASGFNKTAPKNADNGWDPLDDIQG
jgi:hypothetical protein